MQIGFNNDVEFEGERYHIQTEDLGLTAAKITSQIFRGGAIVDSISVPYSKEILALEDEDARDEEIRKRMRAVHKLCFRNINDHKYAPGGDEQAEEHSKEAQQGDLAPEDAEQSAQEAAQGDGASEAEIEATADDVSDTSTTNRMQPEEPPAEEPPAETGDSKTASLPTVDGFTVAGEQDELGEEAVEAKSRGVQMELEPEANKAEGTSKKTAKKKKKKKKGGQTSAAPIAAFRGLDFTESPDLHEVLNTLLG